MSLHAMALQIPGSGDSILSNWQTPKHKVIKCSPLHQLDHQACAAGVTVIGFHMILSHVKCDIDPINFRQFLTI